MVLLLSCAQALGFINADNAYPMIATDCTEVLKPQLRVDATHIKQEAHDLSRQVVR